MSRKPIQSESISKFFLVFILALTGVGTFLWINGSREAIFMMCMTLVSISLIPTIAAILVSKSYLHWSLTSLAIGLGIALFIFNGSVEHLASAFGLTLDVQSASVLALIFIAGLRAVGGVTLFATLIRTSNKP